MQTGKSTVKDIFSGQRIFNVPIYQRAYAWEPDKHLKYFLSDIINQPEKREYFLGSFLFHVNGKRDDFDIIDIVDGQQRLTTTIIFLNVIIDLLTKLESKKVTERTRRTFIKDDDVFKLELDNEDSAFLHNNILVNGLPKNAEPKSPSQRQLLEAKIYFTSELTQKNGFDKEKLERLFKTVTEAEVLVYVVEEITSATQIFELLNDRGKRLTDLESIKSFLMYNMGLASEKPDQLIKNIQSGFAEIYRIIEKHNIDDQDVLRYHTIAFEKESEETSKEFIKKKISELINNKKYVEAKEEIIAYTKRLKTTFELFVKIRFNEEKVLAIDKLFMIGRVAPFYPILLKTLSENKEKLSELVEKLVDFSFKASLAGLRSNGETHLMSALKKDEDIINLVERFLTENWWNINNRAKEVVEYDNYYDYINRNIVKYILFTYENELRKKRGFPQLSVKEYFTGDERERLSIEHITARKAKELEFDDDFRENYLNCIGNLVIDTVGSNSRKGNNNTENKLEDYNLAPIMSQNELDDTAKKNIWKNLGSVKEFLDERDEKMKAFIKIHFKI